MLIEIGCIAIFLIEIKDPCCSLIFSEQRFDDVRYDNFYVGIIVSPISSFSSIVGEYALIIADTFIYVNRVHSYQKEREYITIPCHTYTSSPLEIKYSYKVLFTDYSIFCLRNIPRNGEFIKRITLDNIISIRIIFFDSFIEDMPHIAQV